MLKGTPQCPPAWVTDEETGPEGLTESCGPSGISAGAVIVNFVVWIESLFLQTAPPPLRSRAVETLFHLSDIPGT